MIDNISRRLIKCNLFPPWHSWTFFIWK